MTYWVLFVGLAILYKYKVNNILLVLRAGFILFLIGSTIRLLGLLTISEMVFRLSLSCLIFGLVVALIKSRYHQGSFETR